MLEEKHSYFTATPCIIRTILTSSVLGARKESTMPNFLLLNQGDVFLQHHGNNFTYKRKKKGRGEQEDVGRRGGERGEKYYISPCPYLFSEIISELRPFASFPLKRLTSSVYL